MLQATKQLLWRLLAILSLIAGFIGALLPVMPTVPFILLAAWAASRGWPELDAWLLDHAHFGPAIRQWRLHGAVPRKAKWLATIMMACSGTFIWFLPPVPAWLCGATNATMIVVAVWLWRRPEPPP